MDLVRTAGDGDPHVLHWARAEDVELAHLVQARGICGRPVRDRLPDLPSRPCMNCARRKAAYENRAAHRVTRYYQS